MAGEAFLALDGVAKSYGPVQAVQDISFGVAQGEFLGLLGPSGCGKTTTLQMIAGFETPSRGSIRLAGQDLTATPPSRRNIGLVFQSYALFPHMSAAENVAFGLEMRRVPKPERRARVARALDLVHLAHLADRFPRQMSGGQQQRVALARALVIEPRLLLLDEPLSNLDAKLREEMQVELRELQKRVGVTTILVTHDQQEAMALCDRVAVMQGGRIVQIDQPWRAYDAPADGFVADFLGRSNCLPARAGGGMAEAAGHRFRLPEPLASLSGEVALSIRPERLQLQPEDAPGLPGTVHSRVFLGGFWLYRVATPAGDMLVTAQNTGAAPAEEGSPVTLAWEPHSLRRHA
ncbi:ABC transporter ATP-binding protein [Pseudoroseomonas cervicalis]|uniref:ABC transporter ATP-binding protein n=1 Tax=Teichococcus cervicalis TaxID=204525 RepID=UPI00277F1EDC|nr:ABC transporter ATP-binding protein [Pseudoroseomonas cervicalis]MDQ1080312.1 putative spermidine/putrescine transport system ATP-binding protein [Pseudoroseomonas cervicalis]